MSPPTEDGDPIDAALLCVPADDPRHRHLPGLEDVPLDKIIKIWREFEIYERSEPGKSSGPRGWQQHEEALRALNEARRRFADHSAP